MGSFCDYHQKVADMICWWKENYPELYHEIVFELPDADRNNPMLHCYGATNNLCYKLNDPKWVKILLSGGKKWKNKEKTNQYSFDTPRKYHDAILKDSGVSKYKLPETYRPTMKAFLTISKSKRIKQRVNANWMRAKQIQLVLGSMSSFVNGQLSRELWLASLFGLL